jgi:hypothetical protein
MRVTSVCTALAHLARLFRDPQVDSAICAEKAVQPRAQAARDCASRHPRAPIRARSYRPLFSEIAETKAVPPSPGGAIRPSRTSCAAPRALSHQPPNGLSLFDDGRHSMMVACRPSYKAACCRRARQCTLNATVTTIRLPPCTWSCTCLCDKARLRSRCRGRTLRRRFAVDGGLSAAAVEIRGGPKFCRC